MKKIMLIFCLSVIASAEVLVNESVKTNPLTGVKLVTVLMTIKGDKPYSSDQSGAPAELSIMCQQMSLGNHRKSVVALTLGTGVDSRNGRSDTGLPFAVSSKSFLRWFDLTKRRSLGNWHGDRLLSIRAY